MQIQASRLRNPWYLLCQVAVHAAREGVRKQGLPRSIAGKAKVCRGGVRSSDLPNFPRPSFWLT